MRQVIQHLRSNPPTGAPRSPARQSSQVDLKQHQASSHAKTHLNPTKDYQSPFVLLDGLFQAEMAT